MTDTSAEKELLKAILANTDTISEVAEIVSTRDFFAPSSIAIWDTIMEGWANNKPVDPPILASELDRKGLLNTAGGMTSIMDLALGNPSQATYFAKRVRDQAELRRMAAIGTELKQRAETGTEPDRLREWLDEATAHISKENSGKVVSVSESIDSIIEDMLSPDDSPVFPTGFSELDEKLDGGLKGGEMIIVAARPGVGKSTLAVDIMREGCFRHGKNVLFFSLEMTRKELLTRIMSAEFTVRQSDFHKKEVPPEKMREMGEKLKEVTGMFIDDSPNVTMTDIRSKAKQVHKKNPLDLVVIDYIQLIEPTDDKVPRQEQVSKMSRQIKLLAKELDAPVIAVAQLNRGVEQRETPIPKVSDLRESGSLEQDANRCLLLNRPDSQDPDHGRAGEIDFIIGKNRGGPLGTVTVASQLHYSRFTDPPKFDTTVPDTVQWSPTDNI